MGYKQARLRAGLTQAAAAQELGVVKQAIGNWETGHAQPRAALLPRVAALYGCTLEELLTPDEDCEKEEAE